MVCRHRWWPVSNWTAAKGPAREERAIPVPIARGAFSLSLSFSLSSPFPPFALVSRDPTRLVPLFRHRHPSRSPVHLPAPFEAHTGFPMQMHSSPLRSFSLVLSRFILLCVSLAPFWCLAGRLVFSLSLSLSLSRSRSRILYGIPVLLCFFVWIHTAFSHPPISHLISLSLSLCLFLSSSDTPSQNRSLFSVNLSLYFSYNPIPSPNVSLSLSFARFSSRSLSGARSLRSSLSFEVRNQPMADSVFPENQPMLVARSTDF